MALDSQSPAERACCGKGMFCAVNSMFHRQRRRVVMLAAVLALAGAVVTAHSLMNHDQMSDSVVVCLAVAETAVVAIGTTLALNARRRRTLPELPLPQLSLVLSPVVAQARAGPPLIQVFRL